MKKVMLLIMMCVVALVGSAQAAVVETYTIGVLGTATADVNDLVNDGKPTLEALNNPGGDFGNLIPGGLAPGLWPLNDGFITSVAGNDNTTCWDNGFWTAEFVLDTTTNTNGYSIESIAITSQCSWIGNWNGHDETISYSTVSDPNTFITLGQYTSAGVGGTGWQKLTVSDDDTGYILDGLQVKKIRIYVGIATSTVAEVDITGVADGNEVYPVAITDQPDSIAIGEGGSAVFNIVTNNATSWTWKKDGAVLVDGVDGVSGQGTLELTIDNVPLTDDGSIITCDVSNGVDTVVSDDAVITVVPKLMMGWWELDNDATDSSGAGNNGVLDVGPAYVSGGYDQSGYALEFAQNGTMTVTSADPDYFDFYTTGMTASIWVKIPVGTSTSQHMHVIGNQDSTWYINIVNTFVATLAGGIQTPYTQGPEGGLFDDKWHMYTAVFDAGTDTVKMYIDATYMNEVSVDVSALATNQQPLVIGDNTTGAIDDVQLYNYAMSQAEIEALLPIAFVTQPVGVVRGPANGKSDAVLTVEAARNDGYQWYVDGGDGVADFADDTLLTGETSDTLTLTGVTLAMEGGYFCAGTSTGTLNDIASEIAYVEYARATGHWSFDADDLTDSIGGNTGTWNDGGSASGYAVGRAGLGRAVDFTSTDIENSLILPIAALPANNTEITISMWANNAAFVGEDLIYTPLMAYNAASDATQVFISVPSFNSRVAWETYGTGGQAIGTGVSNTELAGNWIHWVFTCDSDSGYMAIYRDGIMVTDASEFVDSPMKGATEFRLGDGLPLWNGENQFNGLIDDLRIYNYSISPVEVAHLYTDVTSESICVVPMAGDIAGGPLDGEGNPTPDCVVNLDDFAAVATDWLNCTLIPDCL